MRYYALKDRVVLAVHWQDMHAVTTRLAHYDLASLLFDPYVDLTAAERDALLEHYCGEKPSAKFLDTLRLCAMPRAMLG